MTGNELRYVVSDKGVSLISKGPGSAPTSLPFVEAALDPHNTTGLLTPQRRLGNWEAIPSEPLLILLTITLPGGVVRHQYAGAIADRLREITELMYGIDDGTWGMVDLGRFTERMEAGLRVISKQQVDSVVRGGFEPTGWWDVDPAQLAN